jgi:probable F420-dependent oxidoreductase
MQLGFVFPQYEIEDDPAAIRDLAQAVEGIGYDYILAYEHVLGANPDRPGGWNGPYTYKNTFHEPFVLFGFLAAHTQTLGFATGILILPQRQTALVAKQAAQVDFLSGGRLRLGVGVGWNRVEYDSLGEDFTKRGRRVEEQVTLMRRLWTEELVTFDGDFDQIPDAGIRPLPTQRPIPVWFGGGADAAMRRMARIGDGWMPPTTSAEKAREQIDILHGYLEENGRDPAAFGLDVRLNLDRVQQNEREQFIKDWQALGMTHLCVNTLHTGLTTAHEHIEALVNFKESVNL